MSTCHVYSPTCGGCGAFLSPLERGVNLIHMTVSFASFFSPPPVEGTGSV
jgi:hypothetical protein